MFKDQRLTLITNRLFGAAYFSRSLPSSFLHRPFTNERARFEWFQSSCLGHSEREGGRIEWKSDCNLPTYLSWSNKKIKWNGNWMKENRVFQLIQNLFNWLFEVYQFYCSLIFLLINRCHCPLAKKKKENQMQNQNKERIIVRPINWIWLSSILWFVFFFFMLFQSRLAIQVIFNF